MTHEVKLEFNDDAWQRFNRLKKTAKILGNAALIKEALRLYEYLLEAVVKKGAVLSIKEGDTVTTVELFKDTD